MSRLNYYNFRFMVTLNFHGVLASELIYLLQLRQVLAWDLNPKVEGSNHVLYELKEFFHLENVCAYLNGEIKPHILGNKSNSITS